jgi:hypothetical protein
MRVDDLIFRRLVAKTAPAIPPSDAFRASSPVNGGAQPINYPPPFTREVAAQLTEGADPTSAHQQFNETSGVTLLKTMTVAVVLKDHHIDVVGGFAADF